MPVTLRPDVTRIKLPRKGKSFILLSALIEAHHEPSRMNGESRARGRTLNINNPHPVNPIVATRREVVEMANHSVRFNFIVHPPVEN